jgi:exosome complex component RRP4
MVPPILVRRLKSHFLTLPCGVDLILGLNGYIWVSKHVKENEQEGEEGFDAEAVYSNVNDVRGFVFNLWMSISQPECQDVDSSTRTAIARVTHIIHVLTSHFVPLTDALLLEAYEWAVEQETSVKDLLQQDFGDALVASIVSNR